MQGTGRRALRLFLSLCHAPDCAPSPAPDRAPSPAPDCAPSPAPDRAPSPAPDCAPSPAPDCAPSPAPDRMPSSAPDRMAATCSRTPSSPHRRLRRSRVVRIIAAHRAPSASSSAARHQPAAFPSTPSPVPAAARRLFSELPVCVSHTSRNKCMHICSTH